MLWLSSNIKCMPNSIPCIGFQTFYLYRLHVFQNKSLLRSLFCTESYCFGQGYYNCSSWPVDLIHPPPPPHTHHHHHHHCHLVPHHKQIIEFRLMCFFWLLRLTWFRQCWTIRFHICVIDIFITQPFDIVISSFNLLLFALKKVIFFSLDFALHKKKIRSLLMGYSCAVINHS